MERTVLRYAPNYWDTRYESLNTQFEIINMSEEYRKIEGEIKLATRNNNLRIKCINRNQNIHDYGQVLIREQLMAVTKPDINYYKVRRYITIKKQYLTCALEYNLDHRRCGKNVLSFQKYINYPDFNEIILVVQVITNNPHADVIQPTNSSEYFIDYIVELQN